MSLFDEISAILESEKNNIVDCPLSEAVKSIQDIVRMFIRRANLPDEISDKYIKFAHDESFLYLYESYRDHFFHPFHVFLLGFLLLQKFKKLSIREKLPYPLDDTFLKKWLIVSLIHDVTYTAEKCPEWLSAFIERRVGVKINISQDWSVLLEKPEIVTAVDNLISTFSKFDYNNSGKTDRKINFRAWLNRQLLIWKDHGVLSAVILLVDNNNWKLDSEMISECALAIALHNYHMSFMDDKSEDPAKLIGKLEIEKYPLPYLLAYCDNAQEWGRPDIRNHNIKITYEGIDIDENQKKIQITLKYDITDAKAKEDEIITKEKDRMNRLRKGWISSLWRYIIKQEYFRREKGMKIPVEDKYCEQVTWSSKNEKS